MRSVRFARWFECVEHRSTNMGQFGQEVRRSRLRVRKACEVCKKRKVKCDGNQPCVNCVKHEQECQYVSGGGGGRRRYRAGAAAPPPPPPAEAVAGGGGVAAAAAAAPAAPAQAPAVPAAPAVSRRSPWQSFSLDKYRFHRRYQNLLPYYLGASLMSGIPHHAIESHGLKQPRIQNYGWNMCGGHYLRHDRAQNQDHAPDPEEFFDYQDPVQLSVVNKLLRFYFQEINPPLSIIHEPMFWQQFNKRFLPHTKVRDSTAKLFRSMLYLILATTLRFREGFMDRTPGNDRELFTWEELAFLQSQQREESLFKYAYAVVTELTFEWESFELIQSWLLITFYFRTCYRQTACWNALGQAINMCNGMSLYLNRVPRTHKKYDESRAWHCYWACFIADKLFSFQVGRFYQLAPPVPHMSVPGHWCHNKVDAESAAHPGRSDRSGAESECSDDADADADGDSADADGDSADADDDGDGDGADADDWFHPETTQLFELATIVQICQKRDAEELDLHESLALGQRLDQWFHRHVDTAKIELRGQHLYELQPLLCYFDVRLTFETRRLFLLINQPLDTGETALPVDTFGLVKQCQLAVNVLSQIDQREMFFIPWWLNLSLLFTVSVICITLIHSGLQTRPSGAILRQCMAIWNHLVTAKPSCPPVMLPECLWCVKMLNHMCCLRLVSSAAHLENLVGTNPGDSTPNENKFSQFGKVDEKHKVPSSDDESGPPQMLKGVPLQQMPTMAPSRTPAEQPFKFAPLAGNTPIQPQELNRMYSIPSSSVAASSCGSTSGSGGATAAQGPTDPTEPLEEGLFSYLQWFDQNFI